MAAIVGPVTMEGEPAPVTADNAAQLLLHDLYEGIPPGGDQSELRRRESNITSAVIERLTTADYGVVSLLVLAQHVIVVAAGSYVDGPTSWRGPWDRVARVGWHVHR